MRKGPAAASAGDRVPRWAGAGLFAASLGYFLFSYAFTFDDRTTGPVRPGDIIWNLALFTAFALHHSVFARTPLRRIIAGRVPPGLERSLYVSIASILLILVCAAWRPVAGVIWTIGSPTAWVLRATQLAGVWLTLRSAAIIDVRELAGLSGSSAQPSQAVEFKTDGPYGWVRHPIYAGWFLMVFAAPVMTTTRLEFAVVSGLYLLLAIPLEERTIRATVGVAYERYATRVRWRIFPGVY